MPDPAPLRARPALDRPPVAAVGVGIPAHDEEARIAACLESVLVAANGLAVPVMVVVAADRCTDRTVARAGAVLDRLADDGRVGGVVVTGTHGTAGRSRAAALDVALDRLATAPGRCWLASTDADTTVAPDWLEAQLRWAASGADGVAGLVDVRWEGGPVGLPDRFAAAIADGGTAGGHTHVHGANLGLRADRWIEVGGCGPAAVGEDHELWRRLRAVGARLHGVDDVRVRTSGRLAARAPHGFAHFLRALGGPTHDGSGTIVEPTPTAA